MAKDIAYDYLSEQFDIRPAVRHAVPQIMAFAGPTFSGKTIGALLVAGGLVEPGQKIGFIDTEQGRGLAYADDPDVCAAIPKESWVDGRPFGYIELLPPFHPARYIAALRAFQNAGYGLVITDSASHAWSEEGGCLDMKENDKGWKNAKHWNKRFSAALRYSPLHQIVCLRAQEKTKVIDKYKSATGKQEYISLGVQPICEKSFPFDLGTYILIEGEVDGKPATHLATVKKWLKGMDLLFANWKPQLLTPELGRRLREWNNTAPKEDVSERIKKQSRTIAATGLRAYSEFWKELPASHKKLIAGGWHDENKYIAEQADIAAEGPTDEQSAGEAA
jgi:hypothetical protein